MTQRYKLNRHNLLCDYRIITCHKGCGAIIDHKEKDKHETICPHRFVSCEFCDINIPCSYIDEHYTNCSKISIECRFCSVCIIRSSMINHEMVCNKKKIKCPQSCGQELEREDVSKHLEDCDNRYIKCNDCKEEYIFSKKLNHDEVCNEKIISCPDCAQNMSRKNLYYHQTICDMKIIGCRYSYSGCQCTFMRKLESSHYENSKDIHIKLLDEYIKSIMM